MPISVIIATYDHPQWLCKVLLGYEAQNFTEFEILVADDGSGSETAEVVRRFQERGNIQVRHIYQTDDGFRKCRILNKAIRAAQHEYIVISDGDCIPKNDFLRVHHDERAPGRFLSGSYCKLPIVTSRAIGPEQILEQSCFQLSWLSRNGFGFCKAYFKLLSNKFYQRIMNILTPAACNLKGSNASFWKSDAIKVNGFNEAMAWGGEDREFGVRLQNLGIKPKHVRYNAICVHLYHERPYKDLAAVEKNKAIRQQSANSKLIRTPRGIDAL